MSLVHVPTTDMENHSREWPSIAFPNEEDAERALTVATIQMAPGTYMRIGTTIRVESERQKERLQQFINNPNMVSYDYIIARFGRI